MLSLPDVENLFASMEIPTKYAKPAYDIISGDENSVEAVRTFTPCMDKIPMDCAGMGLLPLFIKPAMENIQIFKAFLGEVTPNTHTQETRIVLLDFLNSIAVKSANGHYIGELHSSLIEIAYNDDAPMLIRAKALRNFPTDPQLIFTDFPYLGALDLALRSGNLMFCDAAACLVCRLQELLHEMPNVEIPGYRYIKGSSPYRVGKKVG